MLFDELRNLFLRALRFDGNDATVLVTSWNEEIDYIQSVFDNMTSKDYLRLQQERIVQLEKMKKSASKDEVAQIISKLQRAGILDENGNLAAPYNGKDNMMMK